MRARLQWDIAVCCGIIFLFSARVVLGYEAPRYEIKAKLNFADKRVVADQKVHFTNNSQQSVQQIYFHIYSNRKYNREEKDFILRYGGYFKVNPYPDGFQSGGFRIGNVTSNGQLLSYAIEGEDETLLRVDLGQPLNPGDSIEVAMDYVVILPHAYGRFGWHEDMVRLSRWYPILAVLTDKGWNKAPFYPFHRPFFSEAADYQMELTVPHENVVVHSGQLERETPGPDGEKTLLLRSAAPVREFTLAMSPRYKVMEGDLDGVKIKSFYLPGDEAHARLALNDAKDLMAFYTQRFGKYAYPEFSIAPVHLGYGGEQMGNLIFIDTRVYKLPRLLDRYFDFMISHEAGHQWFYNMVGMDEYTEMWLEEGVESYFNCEYLDAKYGLDADVIQYPRWFKGWEWTLPRLTFSATRDFRYKMMTRMGYDGAVVGELASFSEPSSIFSLTYGKGSRVVRMLKAQVGEEVFNRVFAKIFEEYRFRNLSIAEFIRLCERESGKDLTAFFEQWLRTDKKLDYAVGKVAGNRVTLVNRGTIEMPIDVEVRFRDGTKQTIVWEGKNKREVIAVNHTAPIRQVAIDPQEQFLDIDRTNNQWPRRVNFKPVPMYFGLYDIPAFLPEDGYNVVVGPELANGGVGLKATVQKPFDQILYGGSDYDFGEQQLHSRVGYQLKNVLHSQTTAGFEMANTTDYDEGQEDLVSGKVYLRRELWPAQYGLLDINDHATLYLIRNQGLNDSSEFISGAEDARNISYLRKSEAIVGTAVHINRSAPYPEPIQGYKVDVFAENSGHYLDATQYFYRSGADVSFYHPVTPRSTLAVRGKYGWGFPDDKNLFQLGGYDGLRGYHRKSVRGSNAFMGSAEYRFPLKENLTWYAPDHLLGIEKIGGVFFFDIGEAWYDNFWDGKWRRDAGVGLRMTVNAGASLEKFVVRMDVAKAINDSQEHTKFWFGVNHAF